MFYCGFFSFFQREISERPRPTAQKRNIQNRKDSDSYRVRRKRAVEVTAQSPRDVPRGRHDNLGTTVCLARSLKILEGKKVQNSARFQTTSDFDREYLWNGSRYGQAKNGDINYNLFHVRRKNLVSFGPLTKRLTRQRFTRPRINTARAVWANAIAFARWCCYEQNFNP